MFEITIRIPELAEALNNLAAAIREAGSIPAPVERIAVCEEKTTSPTDPEEAKPASPAEPAPAPAVPKPENRPAAPAPQAAPERTYTFNDISKAGAALCGAGKMDQLIALLNDKYKVQAITELKPDVYGQLAADLIALGAEL